MGGVLDWSTTPGSNTTVDGVSIAEGMQAGLVNNGMRAIMALVREWQLDASGVVTAGAGNAYTITSNQGIAAYADGLRFSFRADRNNTGAATLNVDSRGAKALRKTAAGALTALAADDIVAEAVYDVVYDVSSDVFVIVGTHGVAGLTAFGQSLISAADAAAGRTVLSLGTVATESIVPLAKGGTGVALVDPNADRLLFWDDSAGAVAFASVTGMAFSGTTITADPPIGVGQTWQDVVGSRSAGTSYQNTTGRPIMVSVSFQSNTRFFQVSTDDATWVSIGRGAENSGDRDTTSAIIPDDHYYRVTSGATITIWSELR